MLRNVLAFSVLVLCAPSVSAEPPTQTPRTFATTFTNLAARTGSVVIAEGYPLPGHETSLQGDASFEGMVKVAGDFDYDASREGGVISLVKRHTDPGDLPDVTPGEMAKALSNLDTLFAPFHTHKTEMKMHRELVQSLTDDQLAAMKTESGLTYSALTPSQQEQMLNSILPGYIQSPADQAEGASRTMHSILVGNCTLCCDGPEKKLGLEIAEAGQESRFLTLVELGTNFRSADGRSTWIYGNPAQAGGGKPLVPVVADIASPRDISITTIGALAERINRLPQSRDRIAVDPALSDKLVSVFGDIDSLLKTDKGYERVFHAVVGIYGLRLRALQGDRIEITLPAAPVARTLADLPDAVQGAIPAPVLRTFQNRAQREGAAHPGYTFEPNGRMQMAAIGDLRQYREPLLLSSSTGRAPLGITLPRERRDLALCVGANCLESVMAFSLTELPDTLTHPENTSLTGGVTTDTAGQSWAHMSIAHRVSGKESGESHLVTVGNFVMMYTKETKETK